MSNTFPKGKRVAWRDAGKCCYAIEGRFGSLPKPVAYIMSEQDSQELRRLLRLVNTAESLDDFCRQLKSGQT